jgi:hypothetical protein
MKYFIFIFLHFYLFTGCISSINPPDNPGGNNTDSSKATNTGFPFLRTLMQQADSVLLTSHIGLEANELLGKKAGNPKVLLPLLVKNKINQEIIIESKIIKEKTLDSLVNILTKKQTPYSGPAKCGFDPHQTIFIIYQGKISYIDLCFTCLSFSVSKDLKELNEIGDAEWQELKKYFRLQGFRYRIY